MNNKVKCTKCGSTDYIVIDVTPMKNSIIELRQCNECYRRYRVQVFSNAIEAIV